MKPQQGFGNVAQLFDVLARVNRAFVQSNGELAIQREHGLARVLVA